VGPRAGLYVLEYRQTFIHRQNLNPGPSSLYCKYTQPDRTATPIAYLTVRRLKEFASIICHSGGSVMMWIREGKCTLYHDTIEELTWVD
jgi:hypothetical protein